MIYSFPYSTPYGNHRDFIAQLSFQQIAGGVRATVIAAAGYGEHFQIEVDGVAQQVKVCADGTPTDLQGYFQAQNPHTVAVCPLGGWSLNTFDVSAQSIYYLANRASKIALDIIPQPRFFTYGDSGQLTSLTLTGITRFVNCLPVNDRPTYAAWGLSLSTVSTTHTVTLECNNVIVAQGSVSGTGSITLAAQNGSGLSGSVNLSSYSADFDSGEAFADFPSSYAIYYRNSGTYTTLGQLGTPPQATVKDNRTGDTKWTSGALPDGVYSIVIHQIDSEGNESTGLTNLSVTLVTAPANPTDLRYESGNYSNTLISFIASTTSSVTYNLYDSGSGQYIDYTSPISLSTSLVSGRLQATLPTISSGFTGIRSIVVRAVHAGLEEDNMNTLGIEYAAGVGIPPRPPSPSPDNDIAVTGLAIRVPFNVSRVDQEATPVSANLYLWAAGSSPNYSSPSGTVTLTDQKNISFRAYVSGTAGSAGLWLFNVRTVAADGTLSGNDSDAFGPILFTTTAPSDPASATARGA